MDWERVGAARRRARIVLIVTGVILAVPALLWLAQPEFAGGPPEGAATFPPVALAVLGIGLAGILIGAAWMWRIYRAPTRDDEARWRYRDR